MAIHHDLECRVSFIIDNIDKQNIYDIEGFNDSISEIDGDILSIKEYSRIAVFFNSAKSNSYLLVKNIFYGTDEYIKINPGEYNKLFEDRNEYSMLVPGDYEIRVVIGSRVYYSMFRIVPRHINDIQLQNLRRYVDNQIRGLAYNTNSSSTLKVYDERKSVPYYINLYTLYEKNFKYIVNSIRDIIINPITSLCKTYEKGHNTKKMDSKLIKLNQNRSERRELELNIKVDIYNKENIFVKKIIYDMYCELRTTKESLESFVEKLSYEFEFRRKEIHLKEKLSGVNNKYLSYCVEALNEVSNKINEVNEFISNIKKMLYKLNGFIHNSFFKGFNESDVYAFKTMVFKDIRYHRLYKIYRDINESKDKYFLNYKASDVLYEYYVLLITIKSLGEIGYDMQECEFKKLVNINYIDRIPEGICAIFSNGSTRIEVWYEQELFATSNDALINGSGFYTHTNNRLPDIRIDIYTNDVLLKSFIVEVKYRRLINVWNENINNNDTMIQLKNYKTTIQYMSNRIKRPISPVERVVVVYPGQQGMDILTEKEWGDYVFIQLRPGESEEEIFGFKEYKEIIRSMIE